MTVAAYLYRSLTIGGSADLFKYADVVTEALLNQDQRTPQVEDSAVSADRNALAMEIGVTVRALPVK